MKNKEKKNVVAENVRFWIIQ